MRWDEIGWDGLGWDGIGWNGMGWDGMDTRTATSKVDCRRANGTNERTKSEAVCWHSVGDTNRKKKREKNKMKNEK